MQVVNAAPSSAHWKVAEGTFEVKLKVAEVAFVGGSAQLALSPSNGRLTNRLSSPNEALLGSVGHAKPHGAAPDANRRMLDAGC